MALTRTQKSELTALLNNRYELLRREVREELEQTDDPRFSELLEGTPGDDADHAVARALADLDAAFLDRRVRELRDIEAARVRMADGTFGVCIDCGVDVGLDRLRAYPTAKRCIDCQGQREKTPTRETTPTL